MSQAEDAGMPGADFRARLARIWRNAPGWGTLTAVNHGTIGLRFIVTGFVFSWSAGCWRC